MNKKKAFFNNIKPFLIYWAAVLCYLVLCSIFAGTGVLGTYLSNHYEIVAGIISLAVYAAGGIACGWFLKPKECRWGLALFAVQIVASTVLAACTIYLDLGTAGNAIGAVCSVLNVFFGFSPFGPTAGGYLFAVIAPLLFIPLGAGLRKLMDQKKAKNKAVQPSGGTAHSTAISEEADGGRTDTKKPDTEVAKDEETDSKGGINAGEK